jgi:hypothetical protein
MVYSRNPDVYCRSLLPYFNIARPDFMYTSLQVVWDMLPQSMTQGVLQCSLDGQAVQRCPVFLDATTTGLFGFPLSQIWLRDLFATDLVLQACLKWNRIFVILVCAT